jgi:hypothetical protein
LFNGGYGMQTTVNKKNVHIKLELKEGKAGNMLVVVKFDPDASNFYVRDYSWVPTFDELKLLRNALKKYE